MQGADGSVMGGWLAALFGQAKRQNLRNAQGRELLGRLSQMGWGPALLPVSCFLSLP